MSFSIIAAIGKNKELGKDGKLIFHLKDDMKFFKETTLNHTVVMGRRTWESLPWKLKDRKNIVVSSHDFPGPDRIVHSLSDFIEENQSNSEEIFIIGGGRLYQEFINLADTLYLTEIDSTADADTFFPEFDKSKYTKTILKKGSENDLSYEIVRYQLKK